MADSRPGATDPDGATDAALHTRLAEAERRSAHASRLYALLRGVNRSVVGAADPAELQQALCDVAVEVGGFLLASVAAVDAESGRVVPVASAGHDEGYLAQLVVTTDAGPHALGTMGTAASTGRCDVCDDLASDPRMAPWRAAALARGYRATASFPLVVGGRVAFVLVLFASEPGFFGDDECELLMAVAEVAAFALEAHDRARDWRAAEHRLRDSEARYRHVVESSTDLVWAVDAEGRITFLNEAARTIYGRDPAEMLGRPFVDFVPPARLEQDVALFAAAAADGLEGVAFESEVVRADGSVVRLSANTRVAYDAAGRFAGVTGVSRDVTAATRAADELARVRRALEVLRVSNAAVVRAAREDELLDSVCARVVEVGGHRAAWVALASAMEPRALMLAARDGAPPEAISAAALPFELPPDFEAAALTRALESGLPVVSVAAERLPGDEDGTALVALPLRDGDEVFGLLGLHPRAAVLDEELALLGELADNLAFGIRGLRADVRVQEQASWLDRAQEAIYVRNLDHRITYWNKSAEELYGWSANEVLGRSVRGLLTDDLEGFDANVAALFAAGERVAEVTHRGRDGHEFPVESRLTLLTDGADRPRAILAINSDISRRKALEQQFLRAQRLESIGTLAGGIAHDLNNVLAPITMTIEVLKLDEEDPDRRELLETIESSAWRGADLVAQVLAFARGVDGDRVELDVRRIAREVAKLARETFPRPIEVQTALADDLWPVVGDRTQLHQVLLNLCVNARDAMPRGGVLTLGAENREVDPQYTSASPGAAPGAYVVVSVSDTGTGITDATLSRLFDPFFTTKEHGKGTGLGLSTSLAIVKSHGGFIEVASDLGVGSRFDVFLPRAQGVRDEAQVAAREARLARGHGELILVIDDEPSARRATRETLEAFGYRVIVASDGAEGVKMYAGRRSEVAVVITDMVMPVMDGPATIEVLRRLDPTLPVIAVSGLAETGRGVTAREGVDRFITKPFAVETLLTALGDVLSRRRGRAG